MCSMLKLMTEQAVVAAVAVYEAQKRIPDDYKDQSFFGLQDIWTYITITDDRTCDTCLMLDKGNYIGIDLRILFPNLEIISANQILPRTHMTLWGKDTCRCTMLRLTEPKPYIRATEPISEEP